MPPDRACCSIEYVVRSSDILLRTTTEVPNRSVKPADRTGRSIDRLKGKDTSVFSNTSTKTSKGQTIIHKHILLKGRNNPLEWPSRSSLPADRTGLSKRTYQPIEQPVRSNLPFDRPAHSIHPYLFTFSALLIVMLSNYSG